MCGFCRVADPDALLPAGSDRRVRAENAKRDDWTSGQPWSEIHIAPCAYFNGLTPLYSIT
jgi:hypothetical protein